MPQLQRKLVEPWSDNAPSPRLILKFQYGLNENTDPNMGECLEGYNFDLKAFRSAFVPRLPFDLKGTATNGGKLTGLLQLVKRDNTETTLTVNGSTVYQWDGGSTFTSKGTVNTDALLRDAYWSLGDYLVITDLNLLNTVKTWDGTTFTDMTHTGIASGLYAKFAVVHLNRVWLFNIKIGSTAYPHMILACKFEDPTNWDNSTRGGPTTVGGGSFSTGLEAFYLLTPDLKPINGVALFQNQLVWSTVNGRMWALTGTSAKDFVVTDFQDTSPSIGTGVVTSMGNEVVYPRQGNAIVALFATQAYGNTLQAGLAHWIPDTIANITTFNKIVYDIGNQRVLFFVNNKVLVLFKEILPPNIGLATSTPSAWGVYTTLDSSGFNTLDARYMLKPGTSDYSVFFGDDTGRIFDLYGTNTTGDAGSANSLVQAYRHSRHIGVEVINPWPYIEENVTGHIRYVRQSTTNFTLGLHWDDELTVTSNTVSLKGPIASGAAAYWGATVYWGGANYYNSGAAGEGHIGSINFDPAGKGPGFYVHLNASGAQQFEVDQIEFD